MKDLMERSRSSSQMKNKDRDELMNLLEGMTPEEILEIKRVIDKIIVHAKEGYNRDGAVIQNGHAFDVIFKMPVVKDKLVYKDKDNKERGYGIQKGRKKLTTDTVNLQKGRGKKKDLKTRKKEATNYNHCPEPLGHC